jgi:hypothetical protein
MTAAWLADVEWQRTTDALNGRFRWGRLQEDYACEWRGLLAVLADPTGLVKASWAHPLAPREAVEKVTRGEAAAFLRAIRGGLSLHASAVARDGRALLLSGPSGVGKSTLASLMCERFESALLADDVAGLEPSETTLRLEPSEREVWIDRGRGTKSPVQTQSSTESTDIALLVFLRFDDNLVAVHTRRLGAAATLTRVLAEVFRFDPKPELWSREFELLCRLVSSVPVLELARPRKISAEQTAAALTELFAGCGHTMSSVR